MRIAASVAITAYQRLLSPDHSWLTFRYPYGYCRHYPSCSEYAKQMILRRGVISGSMAAAHRLLRCNPWSNGGTEPGLINPKP
ncbi:membrane protein insertion efficiency factor YidD [Candidatus Uhrbacteria bacterium]|nr:membrane protein insertion efficiency factor YidD [Candidatus Uhrbacteria bacterium]